jgi:hypothetical protein
MKMKVMAGEGGEKEQLRTGLIEEMNEMKDLLLKSYSIIRANSLDLEVGEDLSRLLKREAPSMLEEALGEEQDLILGDLL